MTYREALAYIASLEPRGWRLGLDRMAEFCRAAGLDDALGAAGGPQFIHVAGTNGKGSTTAYLQSMLVSSGYRTGAFFSPFVVTPRERVQLGCELISEEELARLTEELIPVAEAFTETEFGGITEFEFKTALGFLCWKRHACEWVALEVGLGGRLDATNVVTPRASIIVSIALDHTHILGDTFAKIAFEKAGVIKEGVPVVVGDLPSEALAVVEQVARERNAPIWRYGAEVLVEQGQDGLLRIETPRGSHCGLRPGIPGAKQEHNLALALAALDAAGVTVTEQALADGAQAAVAPGRFEQRTYRGANVILDGAHNPEAARVLRTSLEPVLRESNGRIVLVTNMVAGHEPESFYRELMGLVKAAHVVPIDFHRANPVAATAEALRTLGAQVVEHSSVAEGLEAACASAGKTDPVVVTGSFYLVGDVLRLMDR